MFRDTKQDGVEQVGGTATAEDVLLRPFDNPWAFVGLLAEREKCRSFVAILFDEDGALALFAEKKLRYVTASGTSDSTGRSGRCEICKVWFGYLCDWDQCRCE